MDTIGSIETETKNLVNGLNMKQCLFSQLLTSINPFAQFILRELVSEEENASAAPAKHWELDEKILQRHQGEVIKREHLLKTSSEMFSIYMFTKDPTMMIKSEQYTDGQFKAVKDLVNLNDTLLVSSQMANSLLLLSQQEKMNQAMPNTVGEAAPQPFANTDDGHVKRQQQFTDDDAEDLSQPAGAPPAAEENENDVLAKLNAQLKGLLM